MSGSWSVNRDGLAEDVITVDHNLSGLASKDALNDHPEHIHHSIAFAKPQSNPNTQASGIPVGNRVSSARVQLQRPGAPILNSARSQPVLASRPPGTVKDIANRFDRKSSNETARQFHVEKSEEPRQRRNVGRRTTKSRSPVKNGGETARLQRPAPTVTNSPQHTPMTSFDSTFSQSSEASARSFGSSRPLFGEVTEDGWHTEFPSSEDTPLSTTEDQRPDSRINNRRQSENGALVYGVNKSSDGLLLSPRTARTLKHNRSRSELNPSAPQMSPSMPDLTDIQRRTRQSLVTSTSSPNGNVTSHSQLPVSTNRLRSVDPSRLPAPRSSSAAPYPASRTAKSPARSRATTGKENNMPVSSPRSRYQPPPLHALQSQQTLSAKIVAPLPKLSPPLRSSRPRQPVSTATTSASRARATNRPDIDSNESKKPGQDWLNHPYTASRPPSRRRIPELEAVDFAARRARIQKAISQNLSESGSIDTLQDASQRDSPSAENEALDGYSEFEESIASSNHRLPAVQNDGRKLSILTDVEKRQQSPEPATAITTFEEEESPVLGRPSQDLETPSPLPELLAPATYASPATRNGNTVAPLRFRSKSAQRLPRTGINDGDTDFGEDTSSDIPSDRESQWKSSHVASIDQGSIQIMLDGHFDSRSDDNYGERAESTDFSTEDDYATPDDDLAIDPTPRASPMAPETSRMEKMPGIAASSQIEQPNNSESEFTRLLEQYQKSGQIPADTLFHVQNHMVDLNRLSANGGSDGFMVQNLLDSVLQAQQPPEPPVPSTAVRHMSLEVPAVTPDTPPDALVGTGTAVVFGAQEDNFQLDADDFETSIRKADEEWERQQRASQSIPDSYDDDRPPPPPKDHGYAVRKSAEANGIHIPADFAESLNFSTPDVSRPQSQHVRDSYTLPAPSQEMMEKQPPRLGYGALPLNLTLGPIALDAESRRFSAATNQSKSELPGATPSTRPSLEVYATRDATLPPFSSSVSVSSATADSTRRSSVDRTSDRHTKPEPTAALTPEQKRLQKRRHIIRELIDTEYTYHQDLNIIEDIYKATVGDLITTEDKKILFGNCDEVERFSLHFYDQLRRAVASVYTPTKKSWGQRRGSFSTTQSDATGQASTGAGSSASDHVDDVKDRATTVGQAFLDNLQKMDHVYSAYLRNHDAANQRLMALKNTPTVKCWLAECHNNAADITSAWDLDSLLVKPTQRISKYPMLLQQLLDTTHSSHPDHEALKAAAKESITMLTRINDAKKRADLVDQIINRKGKDDVRSGLAKAFGRRTEKLKERVGIAEAFQDPDFDDIAQKFGGNFIRLQICMRDVQEYVREIEKSVDQINTYASSLEGYADVAPSSLPEVESKWRRYCQAIREITGIAFPEHKGAVQKRVIQPMVRCIELHKGAQNAIEQRKKRIIDYAKCKSIEKRGEKPDKKTVEASDMYIALNDHLKLELPRLYGLTGHLVQNCLTCFLDIQLAWFNVWERKLRPTIDAIDIPASISHIEPAFRPDFNLVKDKILDFAVCNGSILADSNGLLTPATTITGGSDTSVKKPSTYEGRSGRTSSVTSDSSPNPGYGPWKRYSSGYGSSQDLTLTSSENRVRSNSSYSGRGSSWHTQTPATTVQSHWSGGAAPPSSNRPLTGNTMQNMPYQPSRASSDIPRPSRPSSSSVPMRLDVPSDGHRFSGMFTSALPTELLDSSAATAPKHAPNDMHVLFVCASLFEFSIDKTRREAGYPYLTYVRGEVFDVVAQKGELWLAKNQDDDSNSLGWIWEQHFVILSNE